MAAEKVLKLDLVEYVDKHGFNIGFKIPPNSHVSVQGVVDNGVPVPFHLTNVCLGAEAAQGERALLTLTDSEAPESNEIVCAALSTGGNENIVLDVLIQGDFILGNVNADNTAIHILGRLSVNDQDFESDEDDEEGEVYDDDEEEYDSDEDLINDDVDEDDDEDFEEEELGFKPKSKVKIQLLPDDEEEKKANVPNGNGHEAKKPKLMKNDATNSKTEEKKESKKNVKAVSVDKEKATGNAKVQKQESSATKKTSSADETKGEKNESKGGATPGKPAINKETAATGSKHDASKSATDPKLAAERVISFVKSELKKAKVIKGADLGSAIATEFKTPFKKMGFEEKTLSKFVEAHAKDDIEVENDSFKLKN